MRTTGGIMYNVILFTDVTDTTMVYKSIGAYKCAHELRKAGYKVLVVDNLHCFTLDEIKQVIDLSVSESTLFVGFSTTFIMNSNVEATDTGTSFTTISDGVFFPQGEEFAQQAISHIKNINENCKVVVGGAKVHANWNSKLTDYVVLGFSERSIVNLANHLQNKDPLTQSYKNIWGCVVVDDKAATEYDFKNSDFQWQYEDVLNSKVLPLEVSRGCIFKCRFCSFPLIGKKNNDYIRDSEQLYKELQSNYDKFGVRYYYIIDDTFNDNQYKLECLLAAVKRLNFQPLFWAYTRLDLVARNHDNFQLLYDIGVRGYYFGIETLDNTAGKLIGKGYDKEKMVEAIRIMRQRYSDVLMHGSFIVGLPEESLDSCTNTFERIISQDIPLHSFNFKGLMLFDNDKVSWTSDLSLNYQKYGYEKIPEVHGNSRVDINWQNNYTNRDEASKLSQQFNQIGQQHDMFHVPGQAAWGLLNYDQEYDDIIKLQYKNIDWPVLEQKRHKFIGEYKNQLYKFLQQQMK